MKTKIIKIDYSRIKDAESIESIICLSVLIATDRLPHNATLEDGFKFYDDLGAGGCANCDLKNSCLACIINE
jgi:hypothetical protein